MPTDREKDTKKLSDVFEWMQAAILSLTCVALLFTFVFRTVGVDGTSMVPTLLNEDRLLLTHLFYTPARGDIVVISRIDEQKEPLIKRVIALAGDTIDITADHQVIVNGQVLEEPYLSVVTSAKHHEYPLTVPEDCVFVMGDNRVVSLDSRDLGPIEVSRVMGKAVFRLWPNFGGLYP